MTLILLAVHAVLFALGLLFIWLGSATVNFENIGWVVVFAFPYILASVVLLFIFESEVAEELSGKDRIIKNAIYAPPCLLVLCLVLLVFNNFAPGSGQAYSERIEIVDSVEQGVAARFPDLDITNAPLVSKDLALRKARVALSQVGDLASQVEINDMTKQNVGGRLMWVGYLAPTGLFRWLDMDGVPGYIMVSATDESQVDFVREVNREPLQMRYTNGAYFSDNAERKIRSAVGFGQHFIDLSEEIDDQGFPYVVASLTEKTFGVLMNRVTGVAVLNTITGEVAQYTIEDAPEWVDIIQPHELVHQQIEDFGEFAQGRFNWSDSGKFKVGELDQVFSVEGKSYYVAPVKSYRSEAGVIGFVFVDTRTGQATRYSISGTGETNAKAAAENSFPGRQFESSNPIPFAVNGVPTYVMTLSKGETVFAYALVSIENSTRFGVGESLREAYSSYATALSKQGLTNVMPEEIQTRSGKVMRIMQDVQSGDFKAILHGDLTVITIARGTDDLLYLTRDGDEIEVSGTVYGERLFNATVFRNRTLEGSGPR